MSLPGYSIIDLSHTIHEKMFHVPGDPQPKIQKISSSKIDLVNLNMIKMTERTGTHCRVPLMQNDTAEGASDVPVNNLVNHAVVFHCSTKVGSDQDFMFTEKHLEDWENENGLVPRGCIALLETGWSRHWGNPDRYYAKTNNGNDGGSSRNGAMVTQPAPSSVATVEESHYPGFSEECIRILVEERQVIGLGTDAQSIEPGNIYHLKRYQLLGGKAFLCIENLKNLDRLPNMGSLLFIGLLPIKGGNGSPARILGLKPEQQHTVM